MTWSIVARDPATGAFGVAVTTRFFAVGALCPHAMSGAGALATQALINPTWGPRGLAMLKDELPAHEVVRWLVASDDGREARQLHVVDRDGKTAAFTGRDCIGWCGHKAGDGFSVAGNMLAGAGVVEATFASFAASTKTLAERFLDALDAGQAEGGDKRGKQSAALIIYAGEDYPALSLRVDDHAEPLAELRRLYTVSRGRAAAFAKFYATRDNPSGIWDRSVIEAEVQRLEAQEKTGAS
ncbi:MAG: DUF1028 domain-containing protein [Ferrovibrio sp.]|uniref:DUF1028 domain-containing protein n=1 Tax=Ferrovibrio sp. TaxID=1917215 RepID=UPI00262D47A2|nr:DUF1028 domain-containing protein [Ferrovibrio sp.]MCW0232907.1 DUF1028 domain-containing protein [Ferrovibrio sp.]